MTTRPPDGPVRRARGAGRSPRAGAATNLVDPQRARRRVVLTITSEVTQEDVMTTRTMSELGTTTKLTVLVAAFIGVVVAALMLLGR